MRITPLALLCLCLAAATPARADLHITRDHGGYVEEYKAKYKHIRDKGAMRCAISASATGSSSKVMVVVVT